MSPGESIKSIAALILCGLLVRLVMRGKWIAWAHPVCSNCQFNLQGLPETSDRCPECGGDLAKVRRNQVWRRRRLSLSLAGVMLLFTSWVASRHVTIGDVNQYLPNFILFQEVNTSLHGQAVQELYHRLVENRLSADQKSRLLAIAVADARTPAGFWLLYQLRDRKELSSGQLAPIAQKTFSPRLFARPVLGRDDPLLIRSSCTPSTFWWPRCRATVKIDGIDAGAAEEQELSYSAGMWNNDLLFPLAKNLLAKLPDGEHHLQITANADALDRTDNTVLASRKMTADLTFTLLPAKQSVVQLVTPAQLDPYRDYLAVHEVYLDRQPPMFRAFGIEPHTLMNSFSPPGNLAIAYNVFIRTGDREQLLGSILLVRAQRWWFPAGKPTQISTPTADLIFRPDPHLAASNFEVTSILGAQLTMKDIPIKPHSPDLPSHP